MTLLSDTAAPSRHRTAAATVCSDSRFDVTSDPRFRRAPKKVHKTILDSRFTGLKDVTKPSSTTDPRGRRVKKISSATTVTKGLQRLYAFSDGNSIADAFEKSTRSKGGESQTISVEAVIPDSSDNSSTIKNTSRNDTRVTRPHLKKRGVRSDDISHASRNPYTRQPAQKGRVVENNTKNASSSPPTIAVPDKHVLSDGDVSGDDDVDVSDGDLCSSTSGCDSSLGIDTSSAGSSDENDSTATVGTADVVESATVWDTLERDTPLGPETTRLAAIGCDWDVINAVDLFVLLSTYLRSIVSNGSVNRVAIYASSYGAERLEYEKIHGPAILPQLPGTSVFPMSQHKLEFERGANDDISTRDTEAARSYQKERSRYYFAVVECDSVETASQLYNELEFVDCDFSLDGLDLRFIPDSEPPFTGTYPRPPKSEATCVPSNYSVPPCITSALRHSDARCTWDIDRPADRFKLRTKRFTPQQIAEMELQDYMASTSSEEELSDNGDGGDQVGSDDENVARTADDDPQGLSKRTNQHDEGGTSQEMPPGIVARRDSARASAARRGKRALINQESNILRDHLKRRQCRRGGISFDEIHLPPGYERVSGVGRSLADLKAKAATVTATTHNGGAMAYRALLLGLRDAELASPGTVEQPFTVAEHVAAAPRLPISSTPDEGNIGVTQRNSECILNTWRSDPPSKNTPEPHRPVSCSDIGSTAYNEPTDLLSCATTEERTPWQKFLQRKQQKRKQHKLDVKIKRSEAKRAQFQNQQPASLILDAKASKIEVKKKRQKPPFPLIAPTDDAHTENISLQPSPSNEHKTSQDCNKKRARQAKLESDSENPQEFEPNLYDERFAKLLTDSSFAIDTTERDFKKSRGYMKFLREQAKLKLQRQLPKVL